VVEKKRGSRMAKVKKGKRRSRAIVRGYLERINSQVFDRYQRQITDLVGTKHGVYALYRRDKLYYVGLATNLKGRIRHHLRDRHKGKWDRFSLYIIRKDDHIREVESLLMRIAKPPGNRQLGKLGRSKNLLPFLKRTVTSQVKREIEALFKDPARTPTRATRRKATKKAKRVRTRRVQPSLKGLIRAGKRIYATYKGKDYKAVVYGSGKIKLEGEFYETPTAAAKAIVGRAINGWRFWKYKDGEGNLVRLRNLRK
jgi:hypothetical protein